jgi:hypothetical protein
MLEKGNGYVRLLEHVLRRSKASRLIFRTMDRTMDDLPDGSTVAGDTGLHALLGNENGILDGVGRSCITD